MLVDYGANINHVSKDGLFALKFAVQRRDLEFVKYFLSKNADPLLVDNLNRNLLHIALNYAPTTSNSNLNIEKILVNEGVDVNGKDIRGRTPLHYLFVKFGNANSTAMIDPIKNVASYCANRKVKLDEPDFWGKTPLHYASQVAATISCIELISKGAKIDATD